MPIGSRTVSLPCLFLVALLSHGALGIACAADPVLSRVVIRHHDVFVQIVPEQHALIARDRLTLEVPQPQTPIRFSLAPTLQIDRITLVQESTGAEVSSHDVPFELEHGSTPESVQQITIPSQVVVAGLVTQMFTTMASSTIRREILAIFVLSRPARLPDISGLKASM